MSQPGTPPESIETDLESHHIEGIAVHGNRPFSVGLISHIDGNLWTGGCINGVKLGDDFRYVVSLYPWEQYALGEETSRIEIMMYDSGEIPDESLLYAVANMVSDLIASGKTLVHCQAGLNRSGLIAGLSLTLRGLSPAGAIALLREKRCDAVLCNQTFETWLLEQEHV